MSHEEIRAIIAEAERLQKAVREAREALAQAFEQPIQPATGGTLTAQA